MGRNIETNRDILLRERKRRQIAVYLNKSIGIATWNEGLNVGESNNIWNAIPNGKGKLTLEISTGVKISLIKSLKLRISNHLSNLFR